MSEDTASTIDPEHREELRRFIETGDASEDFLVYLNGSEECQREVEQAFAREAAHFEEFARSLALSQVRDGTARPPRLPIADPLHRRWNWRGAYPYVMAASLVIALMAGFVTWNIASVAEHEERRSNLLEERQSRVLLDQYALRQREVILKQQLTEAQEKLAEATSAQNRQNRNEKFQSSEVPRLRRQIAELERALASERSRADAANKKLAESESPIEKGKPPGSTADKLQPESKPGLPSAQNPQAKTESRIVVEVPKIEAPRLVRGTFRLPPAYAEEMRDVPIQILVSKRGNATDIQFSKKVSPKVRFEVQVAFRKAEYRPGTSDGEPTDMWLKDVRITSLDVKDGRENPGPSAPSPPH